MTQNIEYITLSNSTRPQTYSQQLLRAEKRKRKQEQKRRRRKHFFSFLAAMLALVCICVGRNVIHNQSLAQKESEDQSTATEDSLDTETLSSSPDWLVEMVAKNPETLSFAQSYADRADYIGQTITLTAEELSQDTPLFFQWDKRWGYDAYGDENIALAGCGPTCLSMAYIGLTGDDSMNPKAMSDFAYDAGFYTTSGTSWSLWTSGASMLGLNGTELPLDQDQMENALDEGSVVICSVGPGDFTTTGHFILLRDYDENGFFVNDPNRASTSSCQWSYQDLESQVKCLWKLSIN